MERCEINLQLRGLRFYVHLGLDVKLGAQVHQGLESLELILLNGQQVVLEGQAAHPTHHARLDPLPPKFDNRD